MQIPQQLIPYAAKLGFPRSETMAKIFAVLDDDPVSVAVAAAMPSSVSDSTIFFCIPHLR